MQSITDYTLWNLLVTLSSFKGQQEEWQTKIILEKINSSSEYEKTMQKSWADVAEDETWNTL